MKKKEIESETIFIILDNGLSVKLEYPEDVFDEVISRLLKVMEFGSQFSMEDYCDTYMTIGDESLSSLNGKRIIGYQN